ncbi:macrophage mannose receptor 1-like [Colossoma macropomum]|uniref:macrophage mannose receptor 1-like n=1 Tax=Colossoma macropomum TaxID=42526 RepID=UPI001864E0DF|nr:macrophage mannose receptor 1-like [Colossoma macropomum]
MATIFFLLFFLAGFSIADLKCLRTFDIIEKKMNVSEARAACRTNYTEIVTVYSDEENTALTNLTNMTNISTAWIGLTHKQSSNKWSNGEDVTFSNLTGVCGSGSWCAAVKTDGSWESLNCTEKRNFMCYKRDTDLTLRYHLISENMSWYEAQSYCRKNYTDLVSIRDQNQNEAVKTEGLNSSTSFWIGLLRDDWEWTDGGRSAYRNWATGQPRLSSDCVTLRKGKWETGPCSNTRPALCYSTFIHVSYVTMSWEHALDYCKKDNRAGFLRIQSESDQQEVEFELRRRPVSGTLWVGLGQSQLFGFWIWTDGIGVGPWTNWAEGRQPEPPLSHHCGAIDTEKGFKWRDKDCRSEFRVLCECKKKSN